MRLAPLVYHALRLTGVTTVARRMRGDGVVLCYHNVVAQHNGASATLGLHLPVATFERQIRWLATHYTIVPLEEFADRAIHRRSLRGLAAVTFDDGYAGVFEHAWPLLRNLRIPATVFVVADAPGVYREHGYWWDDADVLRHYSPETERRWLTALQGDRSAIVGTDVRPTAPPWCRPATWETIAAAAREGLGIGAHSATHRNLPMLPTAELHRELIESRDVIRQHSGTDPVLFAYPYGRWDERIREAVRAAGYRAAFTLAADRRTEPGDPLTLPRLSIPAGISDAGFEAWTAGLVPRRSA